MCKMAMGMRKTRFFMLGIGFCMLLFSAVPSSGEMEGPEATGLDAEEVRTIEALSDNVKLTAPQEIVRDFIDGKSMTRVIVNLYKPANTDRLHNFKEMAVREELDRSTCHNSILHYCQGTWKKIGDLEENLLNSSLKIGEFWHVTNYLWAFGLSNGELGDFRQFSRAIDELYKMGNSYDYPFAITTELLLKGDFLIRAKIAHEALSVAKQGVKYSQEISTELHELYFMGYLAEAKQMSGDAEGAIESISQATEIYKKQASSAMPLFVAPYLVARLLVRSKALLKWS